MTLAKDFINDNYVFDNLRYQTSKQIISFTDEFLEVDYKLLIDSQFSTGNVPLDSEEYSMLKELLNLGRYSKSPCGGFINFYKLMEVKKQGLFCFLE